MLFRSTLPKSGACFSPGNGRTVARAIIEPLSGIAGQDICCDGTTVINADHVHGSCAKPARRAALPIPRTGPRTPSMRPKRPGRVRARLPCGSCGQRSRRGRRAPRSASVSRQIELRTQRACAIRRVHSRSDLNRYMHVNIARRAEGHLRNPLVTDGPRRRQCCRD